MCAGRNTEWEWGGGGAGQTQASTSGIQAEYKRNTSETQATNTLPAGGQCRGWRGLKASLVGWGTAERRDRTQESWPGWIDRAQHSIPGSNFSDEPKLGLAHPAGPCNISSVQNVSKRVRLASGMAGLFDTGPLASFLATGPPAACRNKMVNTRARVWVVGLRSNAVGTASLRFVGPSSATCLRACRSSLWRSG